MSHGKGLPKVVYKTPDEIEQAVETVKSSNLPDSSKGMRPSTSLGTTSVSVCQSRRAFS